MERILMGSIVGFTLLTLLSYLLIILKVPWLIIPIFIFLLTKIKKPKIEFNIRTIVVIIVFTIGIAGQMAIIAPSGVIQNGDLVFWSAHGHDGTWHIALMEEIKKGYPFGNPAFANERLVNYHFFSDVLPAIVSKYLPISNFDLYFRVFPLIYTIFLGASAYYLTKKLTNNPLAPLWATIFTYFAGSFGYLIGKGESVFWATQIQSSSGNPPQIISNFMALAFLYFLISYTQKKDRYSFLASILILGTLVEFKVYAAIVLFAATLLTGFWKIALPAGILSAVLYFPNALASTSFLIYEPWWYIRTMIVEPSRLNLLDWELRRQTYIYEHNWKRVIWLEGIGFLIFFFGNLGMRFLGLIELLKTNRVIQLVILFSLAFPLIFLQRGVASNTAQFLQYFILLFGILAGIGAAKLTSKLKLLIPIILILMVPTQIMLLKEFYSRPAFAKISSYEIEALNYAKENTDENAVLLTPPYNKDLDLKMVTPNIWDWFDTSYVAALSARRTYMDDYEQLDIMGYDFKSRLEEKKLIFESTNPTEVKNTFAKTKANILYFPKLLTPKIPLEDLGLAKLFENQEIEVWKKEL